MIALDDAFKCNGIAALLGGAGSVTSHSRGPITRRLLISNRLQYVLAKTKKNLSLFRAFCVNETTESTTITGKTSY